MTARSAAHDTFVIERTYDATPARVFAAWSDPSAKRRWFGGPEEWMQEEHTLDFRVGGRERAGGGPKGGPVHRYEALYRDIVPDERIVSTYEMHMDATLTSVSIATVELRPEGARTRLVYTEQGVFLDGHDNAKQREAGTRDLLDKLDAYLRRQGASL
ncbi:SRPBCC family protein [Sorangium sp. So ce260]|uniref:SRPBCC family protein n=1 Tax=Sorangium sp. So ce260 TaxID=3133291 RepID=UPI003F6117ED